MRTRFVSLLLCGMVAAALIATGVAPAGADDGPDRTEGAPSPPKEVVVVVEKSDGGEVLHIVQEADGTYRVVSRKTTGDESGHDRRWSPRGDFFRGPPTHATTTFGVVAEAPGQGAARDPLPTIMRWMMQQHGTDGGEATKAIRAWFSGGPDVGMAGLRDALVRDGWNADRFIHWLHSHMMAPGFTHGGGMGMHPPGHSPMGGQAPAHDRPGPMHRGGWPPWAAGGGSGHASRPGPGPRHGWQGRMRGYGGYGGGQGMPLGPGPGMRPGWGPPPHRGGWGPRFGGGPGHGWGQGPAHHPGRGGWHGRGHGPMHDRHGDCNCRSQSRCGQGCGSCGGSCKQAKGNCGGSCGGSCKQAKRDCCGSCGGSCKQAKGNCGGSCGGSCKQAKGNCGGSCGGSCKQAKRDCCGSCGGSGRQKCGGDCEGRCGGKSKQEAGQKMGFVFEDLEGLPDDLPEVLREALERQIAIVSTPVRRQIRVMRKTGDEKDALGEAWHEVLERLLPTVALEEILEEVEEEAAGTRDCENCPSKGEGCKGCGEKKAAEKKATEKESDAAGVR